MNIIIGILFIIFAEAFLVFTVFYITGEFSFTKENKRYPYIKGYRTYKYQWWHE